MSTKYRLNESCHLDGNRFFLGEVHLFDCSSEGAELMKQLIKYKVMCRSFTIYDLINDIKAQELVESAGNEFNYLAGLFEYFEELKIIIRHPRNIRPFFRVADNDSAKAIIEKIMLKHGYKLDPCDL